MDKDSAKRKNIKSFLNYIEENKKKEKIMTGFTSLDKKLGGGFYPGIYILGAVSSLGKTALIIQIADNLAVKNKPVLFFSLEMSTYDLMARSVSRLAFINDSNKCKHISTLSILQGAYQTVKEEIAEAMSVYENKIYKNLYIVESKLQETPREIKETINKFIKKKKKKPIVFIDYLQILQNDTIKNVTDKQKMDNIIVTLKKISIELDLIIIIVSSFNRMNYSNPVGFECFKESGCIEYTADVIMALQLSILDNGTLKNKGKEIGNGDTRILLDKAKNKNPREVTLQILKQRNAQAGINQKFLFYSKNNYFKEVD